MRCSNSRGGGFRLSPACKGDGEMAKAISQKAHEKYNATHYPGTRQMCVKCDRPTGFCEDDALYTDEGYGPLCKICYDATEEANINNDLYRRGRMQ